MGMGELGRYVPFRPSDPSRTRGGVAGPPSLSTPPPSHRVEGELDCVPPQHDAAETSKPRSLKHAKGGPGQALAARKAQP